MARLFSKRQAGPLSATNTTQRTDSGVARSGAALALQPNRPPHRRPASQHVRPSAVLSSAALPQPSTVHGWPLPLDGSRASALNHRIKLAAQWSDVADIVDELGEALAPSNAAYALFRLGCLYSFMSVQRKEDLEASGVVRRLLALAQAQIGSLSAADATFLLDGCTRLGLRPASQLLDALATQLAESAAMLEPAQLPLVLWAFASLGHRPTPGVLTALEGQARLRSSQLTAQGVSLVLSSCQALGHQPEPATLACLEAAMRRGLPAFKRGELASCLEAFKAWSYCPGADLLQAIAQCAGVQLSPALRQAAPCRENRAAAAPHQAEAGMSAAELFRRAQNAGGTLAAVSARDSQQAPRQAAKKLATGTGSRAAAARIGATLEGWLSELGQQKGPELCAVTNDSNQQQGSPTSYWRFGGRDSLPR